MLLMWMWNGVMTLENNLVVPWIIKHESYRITQQFHPREIKMSYKDTDVQRSIIHNSSKWKPHKYPWIDDRRNEMWCI